MTFEEYINDESNYYSILDLPIKFPKVILSKSLSLVRLDINSNKSWSRSFHIKNRSSQELIFDEIAMSGRFHENVYREIPIFIDEILFNRINLNGINREDLPSYYIVDYYIPRVNLVIELDSDIHDEIKDKIRDSYIESLGLHVIRIKDFNGDSHHIDKINNYISNFSNNTCILDFTNIFKYVYEIKYLLNKDEFINKYLFSNYNVLESREERMIRTKNIDFIHKSINCLKNNDKLISDLINDRDKRCNTSHLVYGSLEFINYTGNESKHRPLDKYNIILEFLLKEYNIDVIIIKSRVNSRSIMYSYKSILKKLNKYDSKVINSNKELYKYKNILKYDRKISKMILSSKEYNLSINIENLYTIFIDTIKSFNISDYNDMINEFKKLGINISIRRNCYKKNVIEMIDKLKEFKLI